MNRVLINAKDIKLPAAADKAADFAKKVLKELKKNNWELSILFCSDKVITELNYQYRNKNEATDILSFCSGETVKNGRCTVFIAGDIVISLKSMRQNAKIFKIPCDEELRRLIIHGILHLDGFDHQTNDDTEPMLVMQEKILAKLKKHKIFGGKSESSVSA